MRAIREAIKIDQYDAIRWLDSLVNSIFPAVRSVT